MEDKQFILTSIPIRQLNTMISVAVNEAMKSYQPQMAKQGEPTEQLLSVREAAVFLNLTVPTIYSKVSKRELPSMKRSKRLYFSREELITYVKQGRRKTNDEIADEADKYLIQKKRR